MSKALILIASDGSAIKKPKTPGDSTDRWWCSGGFVGKIYDFKGNTVFTFKDVVKLDDATNNIGELTGLEMAIDAISSIGEYSGNDIIFLLDSDYTLKSVTTWVKSWMKNMKDGVARTSKGTPVKNYEQIVRIHEKLKALKHKKVMKIRSHVPEADYKRRYHEFCALNKKDITYEMWLVMNALNNECDDLVNKAANELKDGNGK